MLFLLILAQEKKGYFHVEDEEDDNGQEIKGI